MPRRRVWCPDLVVKRFPVTNREYIAFLDDLVATNREEEALRHVPRERAGKEGETGPMIYGHRPDGSFELVADADGDMWHLDWPVMMVDWWGAHAYAGWLAARTGQLWRLPVELEWEKTARGVDGRFFPWGDELDPSWCCMRDSHVDRPLPVLTQPFPTDVSPYGVRGMGGNMRDWCANLYEKNGPGSLDDQVERPNLGDVTCRALRAIRGGAWSGVARGTRVAYRSGSDPGRRDSDNGFRLCRSLPRQHLDG
jgi:eukaryotic-like serine/threonine-protein kinase